MILLRDELTSAPLLKKPFVYYGWQRPIIVLRDFTTGMYPG